MHVTRPDPAPAVVVLDVKTGAILAMANYPSFNPNARERDSTEGVRNRALIDVLEPGSVIKPFVRRSRPQGGSGVAGTNPPDRRLPGTG